MWKPVLTSNELSVGDTIRVALDAYSNQILADIHNGRIGVVTCVSSGDVVIKSTDGLYPELLETHHPPQNLEKLEQQ